MRKTRTILLAASSIFALQLSAGIALAADNPDGERPGPSKTETDKNRIDPSSAPDARERGTTGTGNAGGGAINQDSTDLQYPPKRGADGVIRPAGDAAVATPPPAKK